MRSGRAASHLNHRQGLLEEREECSLLGACSRRLLGALGEALEKLSVGAYGVLGRGELASAEVGRRLADEDGEVFGGGCALIDRFLDALRRAVDSHKGDPKYCEDQSVKDRVDEGPVIRPYIVD